MIFTNKIADLLGIIVFFFIEIGFFYYILRNK